MFVYVCLRAYEGVMCLLRRCFCFKGDVQFDDDEELEDDERRAEGELGASGGSSGGGVRGRGRSDAIDFNEPDEGMLCCIVLCM